MEGSKYNFWKTVLPDAWRANRAAFFIIFGATVLLIIFSFSRVRNLTNTRSRIITVERLVEKGTWVHRSASDSTPFQLSIDAIEVDGKIYSSKPPNYPLLMAGQAKLMRWVSGNNFYTHFKGYLRMLTLVNQVIPYAIALIIALLFAREFTNNRWTINYLILALSIGSLPFGYAVAINNHTLSAILFFIAFYLTYLAVYKDVKSILLYLCIGLLSGFAASIDLPGLAFVAFFMVMLLYKNPKLAVVAVIGVLIPVGLSASIFYYIAGSVKPFYMQGHLYKYVGSYWNEAQGFDAISESKWAYLFNITLGHHGLFSITPVLLLSLISFGLAFTRKKYFVKAFTWGIFICSMAVFAFVMIKTSNYGGYCIGLRWFILFMPMWVFVALPVIERWQKNIGGKIALVGLLIFSIPAVAQSLFWDPYIRGWFERLYFDISGLATLYPEI